MNCPTAPELPVVCRSAGVVKRLEAPPDVYYVVQTVGEAVGERQHCVSSSLYETPSQAHAELTRLVTANAGCAYSVWKGSTYIEPARWAYDVVLADGTVLRAHEGRRAPRMVESEERRGDEA